jgi:hypothetical protein
MNIQSPMLFFNNQQENFGSDTHQHGGNKEQDDRNRRSRIVQPGIKEEWEADSKNCCEAIGTPGSRASGDIPDEHAYEPSEKSACSASNKGKDSITPKAC